jgi:hypothetical protein
MTRVTADDPHFRRIGKEIPACGFLMVLGSPGCRVGEVRIAGW